MACLCQWSLTSSGIGTLGSVLPLDLTQGQAATLAGSDQGQVGYSTWSRHIFLSEMCSGELYSVYRSIQSALFVKQRVGK